MPIAVRITPIQMTRTDYHDNLMDAQQGAGIDGGIVQIEPVHNTIDRY